jgi:hypothetical protein
MLKYLLLAAGVSLAVPVAAQTTVQPQVVENTTAKVDVNKIVCQKEQEIGSRLGAKKVCLTVKQWQDRADADRDQTERVQQTTATRPSG